MIVARADYPHTQAALQEALFRVAFMRDRPPSEVLMPVDPVLRSNIIIRQRARFDAAIDRARAAYSTPETLILLLAIADLTTVAAGAGWVL